METPIYRSGLKLGMFTFLNPLLPLSLQYFRRIKYLSTTVLKISYSSTDALYEPWKKISPLVFLRYTYNLHCRAINFIHAALSKQLISHSFLSFSLILILQESHRSIKLRCRILFSFRRRTMKNDTRHGGFCLKGWLIGIFGAVDDITLLFIIICAKKKYKLLTYLYYITMQKSIEVLFYFLILSRRRVRKFCLLFWICRPILEPLG